MIRLYTDGSSMGNPGPSGIGWLIIYKDGTIKKGSRNIGIGTNNIAEIMAIIEGLKEIGRKDVEVEIISDSMYALNMIEGYDTKEHRKMKPNKAKANKEIVEEMRKLARRYKLITKTWVKGHAENKYNNLVDKLAREAAENPGEETHENILKSNNLINKYDKNDIISYAAKMLLDSKEDQLASLLSSIFTATVQYDKEEQVFKTNVKFVRK